MLINRLLIACAIVATFTAIGSASIIPPGDPDIILDVGGASDPLSTNVTFAPTNGAGVFDYYNPTGFIISQVIFQVNIAKNLTSDTIANDFNCATGFFLNCSFGYVPGTGTMTIDFFGVNPDNGASGSRAGLKEGIPPILPTCYPSPQSPDQQDTPGCLGQGHFTITIGGWANSVSPGLFDPNNGPDFTVTGFATTPEPGSAVLFGSILLIGISFRALRSRRRVPVPIQRFRA